MVKPERSYIDVIYRGAKQCNLLYTASAIPRHQLARSFVASPNNLFVIFSPGAFICSPRPPLEKNNFLILSHEFDAGSPPVHHPSALLQVFRPMVSRPDFVPLGMGKLTLNNIQPKSGLIQDRARQCPETVHGGPLMIAEAVEGVKEGIFGDRLLLVSLRRKE